MILLKLYIIRKHFLIYFLCENFHIILWIVKYVNIFKVVYININKSRSCTFFDVYVVGYYIYILYRTNK